MHQEQFLNVIDRDEAGRRFHAVLSLQPLGSEDVPLGEALGRVLAADVIAPLDVPSFDRANVDGFAVRAQDTFGASEERPRSVRLTGEVLAPGLVPSRPLEPGSASVIATGAMVPRGADAIAIENGPRNLMSADNIAHRVARPRVPIRRRPKLGV